MHEMHVNHSKEKKMKKLTIITTILVILSIIISLMTYDNTPYVDNEFKPHVQNFVKKSKGKVLLKDVKNLSITFDKFDEDSEVIGYCLYIPLYPKIVINQDWWYKNESKIAREALIFHEMGHCILYRGHAEETLNNELLAKFERMLFNMGILDKKEPLRDGCPASYMHPRLLSHYCMFKHYDYYMKELFGY